MSKKNKDPFVDAFVWCIRNGYRVYPEPVDGGSYQIHIERGADKASIKELYSRKTINKGLENIICRIYKQKS